MMNKWMGAKGAVALIVIFSFLGNTACSVGSTQLLEAAVAAADAAVAGLSASGVVPAQDQAYVKAILDGLSFATTELGSKKPPAQIAADIVNQFANVELPDLTGLTPQQVAELKALAAAVVAFLGPFEAVVAANQPGAPAIAIFPESYQLSLRERVHLISMHHHISTLEKQVGKIKTK